MRAAPHPGTIWQNGIIVRVFTVYLATGYLAWTHAMVPIFAAFVVITELVCAIVYRRALRDPSRADVYILSYLGVGDIVWFLAGIGFIACGGTTHAWVYAAALLIWLAAVVAQVHIAISLPVPADAAIGNAGKIAELRSRSPRNLTRLDTAVSRLAPAVLICIGLGGVLFFYIKDQSSALVMFLGVIFIGLSAGFSSIIRPAIIALRIRAQR